MKQFNKFEFAHKINALHRPTTQIIVDTSKYRMTKNVSSGVYTIVQKSDNKQIIVEHSEVENFVLWGKKEFVKECKTKFN